MSNWYDGGYEGNVPGDDGPSDLVFRFWMPVGGETQLTFVDDDTVPQTFERSTPDGPQNVTVKLPVLLREHQVQLDGSWKNWFTCLTPMGKECPLCAMKDRAPQVAAFTVIDHTEWTDKRGNKHKDELKVLVVKTSSTTWKVLQKETARRKGLRGCRYEVGRLTDKSPNVGDSYVFEEKVDLPDSIVPVNYLEYFAPKSEAELRNKLGGGKGHGGTHADDEIPF